MTSSIEKQNWLHLASVQIGGAICMPMILVGYELAKTGFQTALAAILIGNLFLSLMALAVCQMSFESTASTAENAASYFGPVGRVFFGLILCLSMCAWFAIQSQVMAQSLGVPMLLVSLGIIAMAFKGIRSVAYLANLAVPLMCLTLCVACGMAYNDVGVQVVQHDGSISLGISLVIAAAILAVVDLPTFFRHARTRQDALKASFLTFMVGLPVVELAGAALGAWTQSPSLVEALNGSGGDIWRGWIWIFILLAGWTTNNANLYSAAASLQALLPRSSNYQAILGAGVGCVTLSYFDLMNHFEMVLELMGVAICSMGAVVTTAYILKRAALRPLYSPTQIVAWGLGLLFGCLHVFAGVAVSPIAILDAALVAACSVLMIKPLEKRSEKSTAV